MFCFVRESKENNEKRTKREGRNASKSNLNRLPLKGCHQRSWAIFYSSFDWTLISAGPMLFCHLLNLCYTCLFLFFTGLLTLFYQLPGFLLCHGLYKPNESPGTQTVGLSLGTHILIFFSRRTAIYTSFVQYKFPLHPLRARNCLMCPYMEFAISSYSKDNFQRYPSDK